MVHRTLLLRRADASPLGAAPTIIDAFPVLYRAVHGRGVWSQMAPMLLDGAVVRGRYARGDGARLPLGIWLALAAFA